MVTNVEYSVGAKIGAAEIGLLASMGISTIPVFKRPVVAVLSTGDELLEHNQVAKCALHSIIAASTNSLDCRSDFCFEFQPIAIGKIRDSNRPTLISALR